MPAASLERLRAALGWLRAGAGPIPTELPALEAAGRLAAPVGRLVVAPQMPVDPEVWGNTAFDQSVQTYPNASTRTLQWPNPAEGARSFLMDSHTAWTFRNGAWRGDPTGFAATVTGPPSAMNITAGDAIVVSLPTVLSATRRYLVAATALGTQNYNGPGVAAYFRLDGIDRSTHYLGNWYNPPFGAILIGYTEVGLTSPGLSPNTIRITGYSNGTLSVAANSCRLTVTDVGAL